LTRTCEIQLQRRTLGFDLRDLYAWIAGESPMVKPLRRSLVSELDVQRRQVSFMGGPRHFGRGQPVQKRDLNLRPLGYEALPNLTSHLTADRQ